MSDEQLNALQHQLQSIEEKLGKIATKPANIWEKAGILLGVLTPLTIAGLGFYLNQQINAREQIMAIKRDRVARLSLVPAFVDALSSKVKKKQLLAVRTINLVMPDEGAALLAGILEDDTEGVDGDVKAAAKTVLDAEINGWVSGLYSADKNVRLTSYDAMVNSGVPPQLIIKPLVQWGQENINNKDGVFNTLIWLNSVSAPGVELGMTPDELKTFAEQSIQNGSKTEGLAKSFIEGLEIQK